MNPKTKDSARAEAPAYSRVYLASIKLRGLAFLFESQDQCCAVPENSKEVNWGISLILEGIADELKEVGERIEGQIS